MAPSTTPSVEGQELQTCSGLGWIAFNGSGQAGTALGGENGTDWRDPLLRCVGSRQTVASAISASNGAGRSRRDGGAASGTASFNQVPSETWALICAGQLSMIAPLAAASAAASSSSTAPAPVVLDAPQPAFSHGGSKHTTSHETLDSPAAPEAVAPPPRDFWSDCRFRCSGITLRLDSVVEEPSGATESKAAPTPQTSTAAAGPAEDLVTPWSPKALTEDLARIGSRSVEAFSGLISNVGEFARETGPQRFAVNTMNTAQRICQQAGKITVRSVEQVGRIASFPFRMATGGDMKPPPS